MQIFIQTMEYFKPAPTPVPALSMMQVPIPAPAPLIEEEEEKEENNNANFKKIKKIKNIKIREGCERGEGCYYKISEGCDVGWPNIHPKDNEGCVGKGGIEKSYTLDEVIHLAKKMDDKPNIIIKSGKNAKWYIKKGPVDKINDAIKNRQNWSGISRYTMYIIVWD